MVALSLSPSLFERPEEMVGLLLEKGSNINAKDGKGMDPLMMAVEGGTSSLVKYLLDKGANLHLSTNEGDTVLMLAAKDPGKLVDLLLSHGAKIPSSGVEGQAVIIASILGDLNRIKETIGKGRRILTQRLQGAEAECLVLGLGYGEH